MSFTDPDHLAVVLDAVLGRLVMDFTAAGRPPGRAFRSPGPAAAECDQLAVWGTVRVTSGSTRTDPNPMMKQFRLVVDVAIQLNRCIDSAGDGFPTAAAIDADGGALATDMWILTRTLTQSIQAATLGVSGCAVARINPVTPQAPSGGMYGVTTTLELSLG